MASNFRTFTITQARIGEPLQFQPALGSKELEELVDAYVMGSASKQDKLSEVTLEFFNLAQVDIYTGLLTRHYNVAVSPNWTHLAFEQSPTVSQSSGFSPPLFTPSPASSMTFADSGYGSISMTPPTRNMAAPNRVVKKAKKDTKKTAEVRLPGFSIMTKDGVDVTSSAGRGTKTKEQREHAHLMRIMKACDECKRKKVRCDPSHRRPQTDMSRSSTSTSSSSRPNGPSPPVPVPSLSRATTRASPPEVPSFGDSAIDDFVLFPEDSTSSWNPADLSLPEFDENLDLSQFNFDISGLNDFVDPTFEFFDQPTTSFQSDRSASSGSLGHDPFVADQYGLDEWASAQGGEVPHSQPDYSFSSQDSGQLDSSFFGGGLQSADSSTSQTTPSSQGISSFAESFWPNGVSQPQITQSSSPSLPSAEVDGNLLESSLLPDGEPFASSMNRRERRNIARHERTRNAAIQQLVESIPSADADELRSRSLGNASSFNAQPSSGSLSDSPQDSLLDRSPSLGATSGGSLEYWGLENTRALVAEATQALKSAPAAYQPIYEELQRLRGVLEIVKSGDTEGLPILQQATVSQLETFTSQLQVMLTRIKKMLRISRVSNHRYNRLDPEFHTDFLRESSIQTRRLVSALCATINNLQTQGTPSGEVATTNSSILSGGRNGDLSPSSPTQSHPQDAGIYLPGGSYMNASNSSLRSLGRETSFYGIQQQTSDAVAPDIYEELHQRGDMLSAIPGANGLESFGIATIDKPRYHLVTKPVFERLSRLVESDSGNAVFSVTEHVTALNRQEVTFSTVLGGGVRSASTNIPNPPHQAQLSQEVLAGFFQTISPNRLLDTAPYILIDRDLVSRPQITSTTTQNVGSSGSDPLQYRSRASSPGAIPGTVLENTAWYNTARPPPLDTVTSYALMIASLVLLNYLQATAFVLPLAALLLATPNPTPATIAKITFAVVVAQSLPLSSLMTGLKYFVSAGVLLAPLFKQSSNGSFGGAMSVRSPSVSQIL